MTYSADQLIARYIEIRDHKSALAEKHKGEMAPLNQGLEVIENALMDILNAQGGQNIKTDAGTAYRSEILNVKVENWDDFAFWVQRFGTPDFLVKSVSKAEVKRHMDEHGGAVPAGLSTSVIYNLNVRRA